jgi:serine/threonine protein kinase
LSFYECISRFQRPNIFSNPSDIHKFIRDNDSVPEILKPILQRATAVNPNERYHSISEFNADLTAAIDLLIQVQHADVSDLRPLRIFSLFLRTLYNRFRNAIQISISEQTLSVHRLREDIASSTSPLAIQPSLLPGSA